jgi:hypothetical protein
VFIKDDHIRDTHFKMAPTLAKPRESLKQIDPGQMRGTRNERRSLRASLSSSFDATTVPIADTMIKIA